MTSEPGEATEFAEWLERWRAEIQSHAAAGRTLPDEQAKDAPGQKETRRA